MSIFNVHCRSVTRATLVKSTFASLVKSDDPPEYLGDVSISYSHSLGTRIRLSLMRSISKRQREKDSKAICSVTSFTARPMMRLVIYFLSFFIFIDSRFLSWIYYLGFIQSVLQCTFPLLHILHCNVFVLFSELGPRKTVLAS